MGLCKSQISSWDEVTKWGFKDLKGKGLKTTISKVVFAATIYQIWLQRNGFEEL
jgi:hypothetical protein